MNYELIFHWILGSAFYLFFGWRTYHAVCKLVWLSNDFTGDVCDEVESLSFTVVAILFWPFFIIKMGE